MAVIKIHFQYHHERPKKSLLGEKIGGTSVPGKPQLIVTALFPPSEVFPHQL